MTSALDIQVSGNHYKTLKYQPIEFCVNLRLTFIEGNIVKYITRYEAKNKIEDLKKVRHYIQLSKELEYKTLTMAGIMLRTGLSITEDMIENQIERFASVNDLSFSQQFIIFNVVMAKYGDYDEMLNDALQRVEELMVTKYGTKE